MKSKFKGPFFTLPGFAIFIIAVVTLVRSLVNRNAYEIVLSLAALALWIVLGCAGAWAVRRLAGLEPLLKPPLPLTASREDWLVTCQAIRLPLFFRLHFLVRGRFFPQGANSRETGCAVFAQASLPRGADTASLSLGFPLGGLFSGEASCRLRDVFGFFSFHCGIPSKQTLKIQSSPCAKKPLYINTLSGAEDRRTRTSSDEERYYMREYAPGDRLRDINWKSSERIDTLITRISPDNQEKITRVEVHFRNKGPLRPCLAELWLLDRAKARLAWFLRSVKEEKASFVFHVTSAEKDWELKDTEEIEAFLEELAALPFSPVQNDVFSAGGAQGEIYVFSTECDAGLPAFLLARQGPLSLFLVRRARAPEKADRAILCLRDFPSGGLVPAPGLLTRRKQPPGPGLTGTMVDYAELRL
jgi:hypothetical protein